MFRLITVVYLAAACLGSPLPNGKIIGGHNVNIEDFPYQASLENNGQHICGATIIGADWVLTAAHCSAGNVGSITIRAGSSNREGGGYVYTVSRKIVHLQYNVATSDYDIALLRIATTFDFGNTVKTIALPDQDEVVEDGATSTVSGWGITSNGSISNHLKAVSIPIVNQTVCQSSYGVSAITPRMICAGVPEGGKDSCQGDSGGPLVVNGELVGTVSWGEGCAEPNYPGVYTRIASFRDWIKTNSGV